MTDSQFKALAKIVLADCLRINRLTQILGDVIERMADRGEDWDGRDNLLRSQFEQMAALTQSLEASMPELRKYLDLD